MSETEGTHSLHLKLESKAAEIEVLRARVAELETWIVDEVDPMDLSEPRRSEWHVLHEKLHPENYK